MITDLGETWSSPDYYEVRDADGVLRDAGAVTYVITQPDGTTTTSTSTAHLATGQYAVDFPTTQEGLHLITVTATGGVLGSLVREWRDSFHVTDAALLVSVDDALTFLRAVDIIDSPQDRETLRWFCRVSTDEVERDLSRVLTRRSFTQYFDGGAGRLKLRKVPPRPADGGRIAVGSVVENGIALNPATDFFVTSDFEIVRGTRLAPIDWPVCGVEVIAVTYTTSCAPIPETARKVALNGVQAMWQTSQQAPLDAYADVSGDDSGTSFTSVGGLTPYELRAYNSLRRKRLIA